MTDEDKKRMGMSVASVLYGYSLDDKRAILKEARAIVADTSIVTEKIEYAGKNRGGCVDTSFHY